MKRATRIGLFLCCSFAAYPAATEDTSIGALLAKFCTINAYKTLDDALAQFPQGTRLTIGEFRSVIKSAMRAAANAK